jgi:hypothetical protein
MILDHATGVQAFDRLLTRHPDDGMVFLERGEAAEHLRLLDQAEADHEQAEAHLTSPHWKEVGRLARTPNPRDTHAKRPRPHS